MHIFLPLWTILLHVDNFHDEVLKGSSRCSQIISVHSQSLKSHLGTREAGGSRCNPLRAAFKVIELTAASKPVHFNEDALPI